MARTTINWMPDGKGFGNPNEIREAESEFRDHNPKVAWFDMTLGDNKLTVFIERLTVDELDAWITNSFTAFSQMAVWNATRRELQKEAKYADEG